MEQILTFRLVCPFWASFRNPGTVNVHVTYPFPPPTTLYGLLNAARGKPQDWNADRDEWQISLVIESGGTLVETFSKVKKAARQEEKGLFGRTTLIRQKLIGVSYAVYLKASQSLLIEAQNALEDPCWPLYLGESDDVVDVVSPHIVNSGPEPVQEIHSIIPGVVEGCRLLKVPVRFHEKGRRWSVDYVLYSLPSVSEGVRLEKPMLAYGVEGRNVVFNGRENHTGKTKPDVIRSSH